MKIIFATTIDASFLQKSTIFYTWFTWWLYSIGSLIDYQYHNQTVDISLSVGCMETSKAKKLSFLGDLMNCTYLYDIPGFSRDKRAQGKKYAIPYLNVRRMMYLHALSQTHLYDIIIYSDLDAYMIRNPLNKLLDYYQQGYSASFSRSGGATNELCTGFLALYDMSLTSEFLSYGYYSQNQLNEVWLKHGMAFIHNNAVKFPFIQNNYPFPVQKIHDQEFLRVPNVTILKSVTELQVLRRFATTNVKPLLYFPQLSVREYETNQTWKVKFLNGELFYRGSCKGIFPTAFVIHTQTTYFNAQKKDTDLHKCNLLLPSPKSTPTGEQQYQLLLEKLQLIFIPEVVENEIPILNYFMRDNGKHAKGAAYKIKINAIRVQALPHIDLQAIIQQLPGWETFIKRYQLKKSSPI